MNNPIKFLLRKSYNLLPLSLKRPLRIVYSKIQTKSSQIRSSSSDISWEEFSSKILSKRRQYKGIFIQESTIDWDVDLFQRPQHICLSFAKKNYLVIYVSTNRSDGLRGFRNVSKNIWLTVRSDMVDKIPGAVRSTYSTSYQFDEERIKKLKEAGTLVYEYIDHIDPAISGQEWCEKLMVNKKFAFSGNVDYVVASAKSLKEEALNGITDDKLRNNVILIQNGVNVEHYLNFDFTLQDTRVDQITSFKSKYKVCVGYMGAMAPWLWYDLINKVATIRKDIGFIYIGPDYSDGLKQLQLFENVLYLGPVEYKKLPLITQYFDICMIPFKLGKIAKTTSPLKLYEYFAMQKPVIITPDLDECSQYDITLIASNEFEFAKCIDEAVKIKDDPIFKKRSLEIALDHSWDKCVQKYEEVFLTDSVKA